MYRRHPRGDARCTAHDAALPRRSRRPTRRRHGRHLPAGRRRRSVRPSFTDLKKRDGSMTDIATLSDLERLVEERAIERVLSDYAYYLDMNMPDRMAELFVEDCEVDYAPNFGAKGMEDYKKTLEGIGTFFTATSHYNSGNVIDFVSSNEARTRKNVLAVQRYAKDRRDSILHRQYQATLVKVEGAWKVMTRE